MNTKKRPNITARDFATILDLNPYQTAYELLEDKIENKHPFFGNKFTEHGIKYENQAIEKFEETTGISVDKNQFNINHNEYTWITGRLDGTFIDCLSKKRKRESEICVLEIKCPLKNDRDTELIEDNIPRHYWCQCQVYMNLIDCNYAYYVEYYIKPDDDKRNGKLYYVKIKRDKVWWKKSITGIKKFYDEMISYYNIGNLDKHPVRICENEWKIKFT